MRAAMHILFFCLLAGLKGLYAQPANYARDCEKYLQLPFVADGHDYTLDLDKGVKGNFRTTFYGGGTYRVIVCSDLTQGHLVYKIYDTDKNLLFSNADHNYTPYWDFLFRSTIDCIIEVSFESEKTAHAQIKLIIAFKNQ